MVPIEERFPRPSVMGVVNVTPDSFSDGGVHLNSDVAADAVRRMAGEGAMLRAGKLQSHGQFAQQERRGESEQHVVKRRCND